MRNIIAIGVIGLICTSLLPASATAGGDPNNPTVRTTPNGVLFRGMKVHVGHDVKVWTRRGDVEGGSRRVGTVARRPLTVEERAVVQGRARAQCMRTFATLSRVFRETGRGLPLSADRCHILNVTEPNQPAVAVITEGMVITEVRKVGFASSMVHVQPAGNTLVNLDTNFYADRKVFDRPVPILGLMVLVRATPTYTWHFGDGTSMRTDGPGAPYPYGNVTHQYRDRGRVVVSVTLNYDTWYQLPGQEWQRAGIVDIPGPETGVQVCEARPVLVDPDNPAQYTPPADPRNPCSV